MSSSQQDRQSTSRVNVTKIDTAEFPAEIDKTISIIIPTLNAGPDFAGLLHAIRQQRKVNDVEILVLDSASQDDTVAIAEAHGARVVPVDPATFSHGGTRNMGARMARGEYLVFLVQDAMPLNAYWLYRMAAPLAADPELMAVCTRQVLPSDADVPYWARYDNSELKRLIYDFVAGDYAITCQYTDSWWMQLPDYEKRFLTFFDDVCSCIRADFFQQEPFLALVNAEDIEYGVRLVKQGRKRGFINSTGVYHFHDRGPVHQLKTQYLGCIALSKLLGTLLYPLWQIAAPSYVQLYHLLTRQLVMANRVLEKFLAGGPWEDDYVLFCKSPATLYGQCSMGGDCCQELVGLQQMLTSLFADTDVSATLHEDEVIRTITDWMQQCYFYPEMQPLIALGRSDSRAFVKAFAVFLGRFWGAQLATFVLWQPDSPGAETINASMESGICRADGLSSPQITPVSERFDFDRQALLRQIVYTTACSPKESPETIDFLQQAGHVFTQTKCYIDSLMASADQSSIVSLPRKRLEELTTILDSLSKTFAKNK